MFIQSFIYRKKSFLLLFFISVTSFSQQIGDGVATHITDFSLPLNSGLYQGVNPIGTTPDVSHPWQHLFVLRHTNPSNNHQLQIGASYNTNDRLFFRKIATGLQSSNPDWLEVATRGANTFVGNQSFTGDISLGQDAQISTISGPANSGAIQIKTNSSFGGPQNRYLRLGWKDNNSVFYPAISINDDLNVGIGTINPSQKLDVNGNAKVKENLFITGSSGGYTTGDNPILFFGVNSDFAKISVPYAQKMIFSSYHGYTFNTSDNGAIPVTAVTIGITGNVGIGTTTPDAKLAVKGQIHSQEVKVDLLGALVPDYVFAKEYKLKSLAEVEAYVKTNSHLPEVPSAKEIEKNGLQLGEMNMVLLKKIEELTLHAIEQQKQIELLKTENNTYKTLAERLAAIEKELTKEPKKE